MHEGDGEKTEKCRELKGFSVRIFMEIWFLFAFFEGTFDEFMGPHFFDAIFEDLIEFLRIFT